MKTKYLRRLFAGKFTDDFVTHYHVHSLAEPDVIYRDIDTDAFINLHVKSCVGPHITGLGEYLRTVSGTPDNRGRAVGGAGAMMRNITKEGMLSKRLGVPAAVLAAAGHPKADNLGFFDYADASSKSRLDCRLTNWTVKHPEILKEAMPFLREANMLYSLALPDEYAVQRREVLRISPELLIPTTNFTTVTVNKNFRTAVHRDVGDLKKGTGLMATFTGSLTPWKGSELILPEYGLSIDYRPGDLCFADVHLLHGNAPRDGGERITAILFARERMHQCM